MKKMNKKSEKSFNGLSPREWTLFSKNVWDDVSSPREAYHLEHGATYPIALADRIIKMYSKEGDLIFDPFVGVGTTVVSAYRQNRSGIGIELNERFLEIAHNVLNKEKSNLFNDAKSKLFHEIHHDDCRNLKKYLKYNSVQLTFTSPPYANFIQKSLKDREKTHKTSLIKHCNNSTVKQYSQKTEDFGNLDYKNFLKEIKLILADNLQVTKKGGYSVWVVKDYRDTKTKFHILIFTLI